MLYDGVSNIDVERTILSKSLKNVGTVGAMAEKINTGSVVEISTSEGNSQLPFYFLVIFLHELSTP